MSDCECQTVKKYGDQWKCMMCFKEFVPGTYGDKFDDEDKPNINEQIADDYKPAGVHGDGTG